MLLFIKSYNHWLIAILIYESDEEPRGSIQIKLHYRGCPKSVCEIWNRAIPRLARQRYEA